MATREEVRVETEGMGRIRGGRGCEPTHIGRRKRPSRAGRGRRLAAAILVAVLLVAQKLQLVAPASSPENSTTSGELLVLEPKLEQGSHWEQLQSLVNQAPASLRRLAKSLGDNEAHFQLLWPTTATNQAFVDGEETSAGARTQRSEPASPLLSIDSTSSHSVTTTTTKSQTGTPSMSGAVLGHYDRRNVVIKAFNYKFRLDLEQNKNLLGQTLIQRHFLPKGVHVSTKPLELCYYHARTNEPAERGQPNAIGAFRLCRGLSGIIHVDNESFVIHPFYDADLSQRKHPHIIYRYRSQQLENESEEQVQRRECANAKLHEWALRQFSSQLPKLDRRALAVREAKEGKQFRRDVSLAEKYLELGLVLSRDVFELRNASSPSSKQEAVEEAIQIVNCLDLYFRWSANTRVSLVYLETWQHQDQIELSSSAKQTLYNFLDYKLKKLFQVSMDAAHLLTGGLRRPFELGEAGMSVPDSICSSQAAGVSQESSPLEPFVAAATMAHMLGHHLGMNHDPPWQNSNLSPGGKPTTSQATSSPTHSKARAQTNDQEPDEEEAVKSSRSIHSSFTTQDDNECRSNCLMAEHFSYLQPPVSFGQLALQQDPSTTTGGQDLAINASWPTGAGGAPLGNLPFRFSRSSLDTYHKLLRDGRGLCLFNKPNQLEDFNTCGNGIVEAGEECDCGSFQECQDQQDHHCCDPITCRFRANAECSEGQCCDRCKLRKSGFVCRKSRNDCDLAELCDGRQAHCPPDLHKQDGYPCTTDSTSSSGYCRQGQCPTYEQQCQEIWGPEARRADRFCFAQMNTNGTARGNCGHQPDAHQVALTLRKFRRCEPADVMCGTLQCQLGDMKPVSWSPAEELAAAKTNLSGANYSDHSLQAPDGHRHQCKAITFARQSTGQLSGASHVRDGTKCAPNKVCHQLTCRPIDEVYRRELCPRDQLNRLCSQQGFCSTANRCHCHRGFTGHDCSQLAADELGATPSLGSLTGPATRNVPSATGDTTPVTEIVAATEATTTTQAPSPSVPPPATSAPAPMVPEKKKHDALGAPTLVFILVSIVAAVYVGFALMANCYRRKGFLKPDKVLRHHQMNCKLDAIRSSFIAKRLADANNGAGMNGVGAEPPLLEPFAKDIMGNPYVGIGGQQPLAPGELATMGSTLNNPSAGYSLVPPPPAAMAQATVHYFQANGDQDAAASIGHPNLNLNSNSNPNPNSNPSNLSYHQNGLVQDSLVDHSADHIPLLLNEHHHHQAPFRCSTVKRAPGLRSAQNVGGGHQAATHSHHTMRATSQWAAQSQAMRQQLTRKMLARPASSGRHLLNQQPAQDQTKQQTSGNMGINRAISLGNVGGQQQQSGHTHSHTHHHHTHSHTHHQPHTHQHRHSNQKQHLLNCSRQDLFSTLNDEELESRRSHRALTTPSRRVSHQAAGSRSTLLAATEMDSCSAPSSPEQRQHLVAGSHWAPMGGYNSNSNSRPDGYHEEVLTKALGLAQRASSMSKQELVADDELLPPLPPPPLLDSEEDGDRAGDGDDDDEGDDDDDDDDDMVVVVEENNGNVFGTATDDTADEMGEAELADESSAEAAAHHMMSGQKRQSEPNIQQQQLHQPKSTAVRRIQLNSGDLGGYQHRHQQHQQNINESSLPALSLIAQLQQLERVQSLYHQEQVAAARGRKQGNMSGELHEFFSLPLSLQLSALLARTLAGPPLTPTRHDGSAATMDDYVNLLNTSSVVASSRRSFKRSSGLNLGQHQAAGPSQSAAQSASGKDQQFLAQPQQAAGNTETLKRQQQQLKLHNLQGLINRLQKLHNQTVEELVDGELAVGSSQPDVMGETATRSSLPRASGSGSRQSTLGRRQTSTGPQNRPASRATTLAAADDDKDEGCLTPAARQQLRAKTGASRASARCAGRPRNLNDSVYSMSDSEDGFVVSRMLVTNRQQKMPPPPESKAGSQAASNNDTVDDVDENNCSSDKQQSPTSSTQESQQSAGKVSPQTCNKLEANA